MNLKTVFLLVSFLLNTSLYSTGTSIALLQSKQNPEKFIVLLSDYHQTRQDIDQMQIEVIDGLLELAEKFKEELTNRITVLIECSPQITGKVSQLEDKALIWHVMNLYMQQKLFLMNPIACDIECLCDILLGYIITEFFPLVPPPGYYENFGDLYNTAIAPKGPRYKDFKEYADTIKINVSSGPAEIITIGSYLDRLEYLDKFVHNALLSISGNYEMLLEAFVLTKKGALDIINSYKLDPSTTLVRLAVIAEERAKDGIEAYLKFDRLERPISIARDIAQLTALVKSQEKTDLSVLFSGGNHISSIQDALLTDYILVDVVDLARDLIVNNDLTYTFNALSKPELLNILKRIVLQIPWLSTMKSVD